MTREAFELVSGWAGDEDFFYPHLDPAELNAGPFDEGEADDEKPF